MSPLRPAGLGPDAPPRWLHPGAWWLWALGLGDRGQPHHEPAAAGC